MRLQVVRAVRAYSKVSGNQILANNVVIKSLKYVKEVDDKQFLLTQASTEDKIDKLLLEIGHNKELLYLLSLFHFECAKLGISRENPELRTPSMKFYWNHVFKLTPINTSFWDLCHLLNISNHTHHLNRSIVNLGLLDPKNFSSNVYTQLQSGKFNDTDFSSVETTSFERPEFKPREEEKK